MRSHSNYTHVQFDAVSDCGAACNRTYARARVPGEVTSAFRASIKWRDANYQPRPQNPPPQ